MPNIVIIEKNGSMKQINIKSFVESDLYKKAGFKMLPVMHSSGLVKEYWQRTMASGLLFSKLGGIWIEDCWPTPD